MNEPKTAILRPVRTEYGKEIRKDYEAGNITEKWSNIRQGAETYADGIWSATGIPYG